MPVPQVAYETLCVVTRWCRCEADDALFLLLVRQRCIARNKSPKVSLQVLPPDKTLILSKKQRSTFFMKPVRRHEYVAELQVVQINNVRAVRVQRRSDPLRAKRHLKKNLHQKNVCCIRRIL